MSNLVRNSHWNPRLCGEFLMYQMRRSKEKTDRHSPLTFNKQLDIYSTYNLTKSTRQKQTNKQTNKQAKTKQNNKKPTKTKTPLMNYSNHRAHQKNTEKSILWSASQVQCGELSVASRKVSRKSLAPRCRRTFCQRWYFNMFIWEAWVSNSWNTDVQ